MDRVLARFADPAGGFFDTADDHERLVARPKDLQDNAVPSGQRGRRAGPAAAGRMDGRGPLPRRRRTGAPDRRRRSSAATRPGSPSGSRRWTWRSAPAVEVAIVGDPGDPATRALLDVVETGFRPHQVVAVSADPAASVVPLLADRIAIDGRPTAYVCRGFVCRLPVTDVDGLRTQLTEAMG